MPKKKSLADGGRFPDWMPPQPTEIYMNRGGKKQRVCSRNYTKRDGDYLTLAAEFTVMAFSRTIAWREGLRAARAIVSNYFIPSVVVEYRQDTEDIGTGRVRVYQRFNPADWPDILFKSDYKSERTAAI